MDCFNLYTKNPDLIMDQVPYFSTEGYNLFPNFPMVYLSVKPWIHQENRLWVITKGLPSKVYNQLRKKKLVPIYGHDHNHDQLEYNYYHKHCYNHG